MFFCFFLFRSALFRFSRRNIRNNVIVIVVVPRRPLRARLPLRPVLGPGRRSFFAAGGVWRPSDVTAGRLRSAHSVFTFTGTFILFLFFFFPPFITIRPAYTIFAPRLPNGEKKKNKNKRPPRHDPVTYADGAAVYIREKLINKRSRIIPSNRVDGVTAHGRTPQTDVIKYDNTISYPHTWHRATAERNVIVVRRPLYPRRAYGVQTTRRHRRARPREFPATAMYPPSFHVIIAPRTAVRTLCTYVPCIGVRIGIEFSSVEFCDPQRKPPSSTSPPLVIKTQLFIMITDDNTAVLNNTQSRFSY